MKIDPNGSSPEAGMINDGLAYQGEVGIGRGILFTRQGLSDLPIQCLPNIVPAIDSGKETEHQMTVIFNITDRGITPRVL
jgi:hypothetical protein